MRNSIIFIFFLFIFTPQSIAEELPWFSLECNLRKSDLIVQATIIDDKGHLKIEKYYKGQSQEIIQIDKFAIQKDERFDSGFPKQQGKTLVLFINLETDATLLPAFWSWSNSVLWLEKGKYLGVIQLTNPGGYELVPFFLSEKALKKDIDNWLFFERVIAEADTIQDATERIDYLFDLFQWHPFKEDVLKRLAQEEPLPFKKVEHLLWQLHQHHYLSQSDLYPCGWLDYDLVNYYQLAFQILKNADTKHYTKYVQRFINALKRQISDLEKDNPMTINEHFLLELIKFFNDNPNDIWTKEKQDIYATLQAKESFCNPYLLKLLLNEFSKG